MNKIKVLHIIPDFGTGGAEKLVLDLVANYNSDKFEVAILSLYDKADTIYEKQLEKNGAKVFYLDKKPGLDVSIIMKTLKIFNLYKPEIIHTHRYVVRYTLIPSILKRIPVKVHTVHNIAEKELDKIGLKLQRIAYKYFGYKPVAIANSIKNSIESFYKMESNVPLINNGVDLEKYPLSIRGNNNIIELIHIGRFSPQKNHEVLIDAFNFVVKERKNIRLTLVGDGELRESIEAKVKALGIGNYIKFLGIREDIPDLLAASDIFVMSSDWEGLPLTVLEAMSTGMPIISTNVGGVPDICENGKNGFLVDSQNPKQLYEAIIRIADDQKLRYDMGQKSYQLSKEYDIKTVQKKYEELYMSCYGEVRPK